MFGTHLVLMYLEIFTIITLKKDAFEKFVSTSVKHYNLDPCHYFSAPRLSWDPKNGNSRVRKN